MGGTNKALGACVCGNSEAGILPDPCEKGNVFTNGGVGVTWVTDVLNKEALTISTTRVMDKDKFPSHSGKPKDGGFMPKDCVVVESGGKL
jgi:hypothetical protein